MSYRRRKPLLEAAHLERGTLARFAHGLSWTEIVALDTSVRDVWWSHAVGNAEDEGILWWDRARRTWHLTDKGRDMTEPKRTESAELTLVIPRDALPPISIREPDEDTLRSAVDSVGVRDAQREAEQDRPTLVRCPACRGCALCDGQHMVMPERAAAWQASRGEP